MIGKQRYFGNPLDIFDESNFGSHNFIRGSGDGLDVLTKGTSLDYNGGVIFMTSIDLSFNSFMGEIPEGICFLTNLINLNFLSNLTSLSLNLSYNNLLGRIPSGNQLQTLDDPSIYVGNSGLCGPPLSKNCSGNEIIIPQGNGSNEEDGSDIMYLYLGICIGFIFGLCVKLGKKF
ncbi:hypothetical protein LUZ60_008494 [Juncus effusus]|nr:hypothetical protein LUZ60_008494 [Juncus effusus]